MPDVRHPDSERLDRLRAGLLDERPAERSALEAHLSACPECRERLDSWRQLRPEALGPRPDSGALSAELAAARRQALQAAASSRHQRRFPAYAVAAVLLLALGTGLWWSLQPALPDRDRLASLEDDSIPDPYEDLDFYLWLANQHEPPEQEEHVGADNT